MGRTVRLGCLNLAVWDFVIVAALAGIVANKTYELHPFYSLLVGCGAGTLLLILMRIRFLGSLLQIACGLLWSQAIWRIGYHYHPTEDPIWYWGMQGLLAVVCVALHFMSVNALLGPKKDYSHKSINTAEVEDRYMAVDLEDDPEEVRERFCQIREDFLDACDERDEVMDLAQEILDEDDSPDTDDLYRLMLENDRIWTEGSARMSVYADMIRDARTYQEQKQAMRRAEKLLSDLERITYEVMRETNRVMALEKGLYLEDEECEEASEDEVEGEYEEDFKYNHEEAKEPQNLGNKTSGEIDTALFAGCRDKDSLTKRYRSLMKTFHPDNQDGDTEMTIKVQKTYDYMMKQMG